MDQREIYHNGLRTQLKKPYKKPELNRVHLVAEEVVLAICKTGSFGGRTLCQNSGYVVCIREQTS